MVIGFLAEILMVFEGLNGRSQNSLGDEIHWLSSIACQNILVVPYIDFLTHFCFEKMLFSN